MDAEMEDCDWVGVVKRTDPSQAVELAETGEESQDDVELPQALNAGCCGAVAGLVEKNGDDACSQTDAQ